MQTQAQDQHRWLHRLAGQWTSETRMPGPPGQPDQTLAGTESVRTLGDLWVVCEGRGDMPGGGTATMIMTLGYSPERQCHVGTWVGSMMTHLWVYEGSVDATGQVLTLESTGPAWTPEGQPIAGKSARYRDVITFLSDDHRTLSSRVLGDDGQWSEPFMTVHYRRTASAG